MSAEIFTTKANNAYIMASAFLLGSILQWFYFKYLDTYQVLFDNSFACLVILMTALIAILVFRFENCQLMPIWSRVFYALILVELTVVGAGDIITSSPAKTIAVSFFVIAALFTFSSILGCYMMTADTTLFLGMLFVWTFLSLIVCVLALTFLLAIEDWQVDYGQILIFCIYPGLIFNIAYDSRKINNPDKEITLLEDNLSYGLYMYGEYVALLVVTITLVKQ